MNFVNLSVTICLSDLTFKEMEAQIGQNLEAIIAVSLNPVAQREYKLLHKEMQHALKFNTRCYIF